MPEELSQHHGGKDVLLAGGRGLLIGRFRSARKRSENRKGGNLPLDEGLAKVKMRQSAWRMINTGGVGGDVGEEGRGTFIYKRRSGRSN